MFDTFKMATKEDVERRLKQILKEIEDLKLKNSKIEKELEEGKWKIKSPTLTYKSFMEKAERFSLEEHKNQIGLSAVEAEKVQKVWKDISSQTFYIDMCSEKSLFLFGDGNPDSFMNVCLDSVVKEFGGSFLNIHRKPSLPGSSQIDFVICPSRVVNNPSWMDCFSFIGCKQLKAFKSDLEEEGGQVIEYGRISHQAMSESDVNSFRLSIVTDVNAIQFFVFIGGADTLKTFATEIMDFVPDSPSDCTEGVKLLCQFIQLMAKKSSGLSSSLRIDAVECQIQSLLQENTIIKSICQVDYKGSKCVAKFSKGANGRQKYDYFITREYYIYKALEQSHVRLLKMHEKSHSQLIIFEEFGETLKSWSEKILFKQENEAEEATFESKKLFLLVLRDFLDEIVKLHKFGFTHGDIRPDNTLLLNDSDNADKICLIDFEWANRIETPLETYFGTSLYTATNLIMKDERPFIFLKSYDLESFVISFLDCIAPDLLQMIIQKYKPGDEMIDEFTKYAVSKDLILFRDTIIHNIVSSEHPTELEGIIYNSDLVKIFIALYHEINELKSNSNSNMEHFYHRLNEILRI